MKPLPVPASMAFPFRQHKTQMEILYPGVLGKARRHMDGKIAKHYRDELTLEQIAERIGCSVTTVNSRIRFMELPPRRVRQNSLDKG